jgi:hypothetical protein
MDISRILDALLILGTSPAGTSHGIPGVSENVRQLVEMLPDEVILEVGEHLGIDTSRQGRYPLTSDVCWPGHCCRCVLPILALRM